MELEAALARDTSRARVMLQDVFGEIRLVEAGRKPAGGRPVERRVRA